MNKKLKIIIAPDSFKGCLTADEVAQCCEKAILKIRPNSKIEKLPLSDGGDGFAEIYFNLKKGVWKSCQTVNALNKPIEAGYILDGKRAIIESASACGITLFKKKELNPLLATTRGLGIIIRDAINNGAKEIFVGLGGSATNDGGMGMLRELGIKFIGANGKELLGCGEDLGKAKSIIIDKDLIADEARFFIICDVDNPLLGEKGCAKIFSPQKGASPKEVELLEEGMTNYSDIVSSCLKKDFTTLKGSGAAGGLGFAFQSFFNASSLRGVDFMLDLIDFEDKIKDSDLIITGEGALDSQSVMGKTITGVLDRAAKYKIPVIGIAGKIENEEMLLNSGFFKVFSINPPAISEEDAMKKENACINIEKTISKIISKKHCFSKV